MRYMVESYLPVATADGQEAIRTRVRAAADELAGEGARLRHLDCIFVPEDEMCLLLYEADSPELVRQAGDRAGIQYERVMEAPT